MEAIVLIGFFLIAVVIVGFSAIAACGSSTKSEEKKQDILTDNASLQSAIFKIVGKFLIS